MREESSFTQEGRERLGRLIQKSLEVRGWTYRDLSEKTSEMVIDRKTGRIKPEKVTKDTIGRLCNGQTKIPHPQTLEKLAPFIFCLIGIETRNGVECPVIDQDRTYKKEEWIELQAIATEQWGKTQKKFRAFNNPHQIDLSALTTELLSRIAKLENEVEDLKQEINHLKLQPDQRKSNIS